MIRVFIFHGTEGNPQENWFPWLKSELEQLGCEVITPQFPSPPVIAAKLSEWFAVFSPYMSELNKDTIIIGHSLGGIFLLRVLEKINSPLRAAIFTGTPIGIPPIRYLERDREFSGFEFDWLQIRRAAMHFKVFHSDNDPYVDLANGKTLAQKLNCELNLIPRAGHFNKEAGYTTFKSLKGKLVPLIRNQ